MVDLMTAGTGVHSASTRVGKTRDWAGSSFAAEDWVRERSGREIRMTVVNIRDTLIAGYLRCGYVLTSETEPFPYGDNRFGIAKRDDMHVVVLASA